MVTLVAALVVAAVVWAVAQRLADAARGAREDAVSARMLDLLATFRPAVGEADEDPRAILKWDPLVRTARQAWPQEFAKLDAASGGSFPFSKELLQAAHTRWTADWLAWELAHDTEYKLKVAVAEHELAAAGNAPHARAKLDAVEREKLDLYQRRYAEYIRVAKALQAML